MKKLVVVVVLVLMSVAVYASPGYRVTDLGAGAIPSKLNDYGTVAGCFQDINWNLSAMIWPAKGRPINLNQRFGWSDSRAYDVNNAGQASGHGFDYQTGKPSGAFIYQNGAVRFISNMVLAYRLNENGMVYGYRFQGDKSIATCWFEGVGFDLPMPIGFDQAIAWHGNKQGDVIGQSRTETINEDGSVSTILHAILWRHDGKVIDLNPPDAASSDAFGINEKCQVVGYIQNTSDSHYTAVAWDENGNVTNLGTLGGSYSEAYDINDQGTIVGSAETAAGVNHAFIYKNGVMTDLNTLLPKKAPRQSWELTDAFGINNNYAITGVGNFRNSSHGFMATTHR